MLAHNSAPDPGKMPPSVVPFLAEGNPESDTSFSGSSRRLVEQLRRLGLTVVGVDVDLRGAGRALAAAMSFSPDRFRWWVRFHLNETPYYLRSLRARKAMSALGRHPSFIFQVGATFEPPQAPFVLYCDSNISLAMRHPEFSEARALSRATLVSIRRREEALYQRAGLILTISEYTRDSFVTEFGCDPDRVRAVYAGPNYDWDNVHIAGFPPGAPDVLFVGLQGYRKGLDLLLAAHANLRTVLPELTLTIVGPRDLPSDGAKGIRSLGFLNKDIPADRERLFQAFREASVFCLPTRFEPFGIALLEAMSFGLPCVATRGWAIPEIVAADETGVLVPVNDAPALESALGQVLGDRARARAMGERGRRRCLELFTWERTGDRIREALLSRRQELGISLGEIPAT